MEKYSLNITKDSYNVKFVDEKTNSYKSKFHFFLPENSSVNYCNIEDVNTNENFYYVIQYFIMYNDCIDNNQLIKFSDEVKNAITHKNLKIIFFEPHESPYDLEQFVYKLKNTIKINNWKEENFYIIDNNSFIYKIKEKTNSKINFYKINALLRMIGGMMKLNPVREDICFDKKFIFLCQNRGPHNHRISLLTHLKSLKLLEDDITDWSWVVTPGENSKRIQTTQHLKKYIEPNNKILIKNYLEIVNQKKLGFYEQNVDWFDRLEYYTQTEHLTLDSFKNSYINIVPETRFEYTENNMHITEKTFKPFYYFQIPIFLAQHNHIKTLREEYDFYLFDDLIDHSYDNEPDDTKRFNMVVNEINRLSNMRDEINLYYKDNVDKLFQNYNYIKTYPNQRIEENYFFNLINENK